jgi:Fe-S-cluster-containing dehydrogenase component/CRP-like cAMP-binding protein
VAEPLAIQRPARWGRPFGPDMSEADVDRILALPRFRDVDPERFPEQRSLRAILKNDARITWYPRGDIIVHEGDYGNSLFCIIRGKVRVVLSTGPGRDLGRSAPPRKRSFLGALSQLWRNAKLPEARDVAAYRGGPAVGLRRGADYARAYVTNVEEVIAGSDTIAYSEGEIFGEIAALARTARTATVFAETETEVVELRWQGLRDLRRYDHDLRAAIDAVYRARALTEQLRTNALFADLDDSTLREIARETSFESHGEEEWFRHFKRTAEPGSDQALEQEPVIAEQGHHLDTLIMIVSGFARITERLDFGRRTVGYLGTNELFGLDELTDAWRHRRPARLRHSLHAIGQVDILRVPAPLVEQHILPKAQKRMLPAAGVAEPGLLREPADGPQEIEQALLEFLINGRTINGTAAMLINADRCTGCDDCVRACASTHNNNPRFIRHGPAHGSVMVANACMHCVDPVCLIGCPTGAIHRDARDGRVIIDDATCIGCSTCANACPYNNIQMVEVRDHEGAFILDQETGEPIVKAAKCDLCLGQLGGPACQRACPHDALIRIDMRDHRRLADWISRP